MLGGELTIVAERPTPDNGVTAVFESMVADTSSLIVGPATSADARAIMVAGKYCTLKTDEVHRLESAGVQFGLLSDRQGRIMTIPVN